MLGETAQLAVNLSLHDGLSPGLARAEGELQGFNKAASTTGTAVTKAGTAMHAASGHAITLAGGLSHAKHALTDLISGPLGMIGLGVAGFGIVKFFDDAVQSTYEFGNAAIKLQKIIGGTVESASALLAVGEKYGVTFDKLTTTAAFYEKTVGKLEGTFISASKAGKSAALQNLETQKLQLEAAGKSTTAINKQIREQKALDALRVQTLNSSAQSINKLQALEAQYGVRLTDNTGKALSFGKALNNVADFYAKSTDKARAASLAAQVFGRGYASLAPLLALGSKGIKDAADEAAALGVTLTGQTAKDLIAAKQASRDFGEAMMGLKLAIGTQVVPVLTELQKSVTSFLTHGGVQQIKGAVTAILGVAKEVAGVAGTIGSAFATAWGRIPGPLQQLLIGGLVANKVIKFTFGFSGLDILKTVLGGGIGGVLGRGGSPANPVWVASVGGGGPGGVPGVPGGGLSALGVAGAVGGGLAIGAAFKILVQDPQFDAATKRIINDARAQLARRQTVGQLTTARNALQTGINELNALPGGSTLYAGQIEAFQKLLALYNAAISKATKDAMGTLVMGTTKDKERPRNQRDVLTPDKVTRSMIEGNRDVAKRRDITNLGFNIAQAVRSTGGNITAIERAGLAAVTTAVWAVEAKIGGISGLAAQLAQGRPGGGPQNRGRGATPAAPDPGDKGQNRGSGRRSLNVFIKPTTSARQNDSASAVQSSYGPTPARSGAAYLLPGT